MPVPSAVTGFVAQPDTQQGYVVLTWTNPGSITGTKIEASVDDGVTWAPLYDDVAVSTKSVLPCPDVPTSYRVSAKNGSGYSTPVTANNVILKGQGRPNLWRVWLNAVDDEALKVPLGRYSQASSTRNWQPVDESVELVAGGQTDSDWAFPMHQQLLAPSMSFLLRSYNLEDGSRQKPYPLVQRLQRMQSENHLLLYRDNTGLQQYCRMFSFVPSPVDETGWQVVFTLKSARPPLYPLTF